MTGTIFLTDVTDLETVKESPDVLLWAPACSIDVIRGGVPKCETEIEPPWAWVWMIKQTEMVFQWMSPDSIKLPTFQCSMHHDHTSIHSVDCWIQTGFCWLHYPLLFLSGNERRPCFVTTMPTISYKEDTISHFWWTNHYAPKNQYSVICRLFSQTVE